MNSKVLWPQNHTEDATSQEQVRRFQQHSRLLPAVPTRYLEQLERPKHRFLTEEGEKKAFLFKIHPQSERFLTLYIFHRISIGVLWELQMVQTPGLFESGAPVDVIWGFLFY